MYRSMKYVIWENFNEQNISSLSIRYWGYYCLLSYVICLNQEYMKTIKKIKTFG